MYTFGHLAQPASRVRWAPASSASRLGATASRVGATASRVGATAEDFNVHTAYLLQSMPTYKLLLAADQTKALSFIQFMATVIADAVSTGKDLGYTHQNLSAALAADPLFKRFKPLEMEALQTSLALAMEAASGIGGNPYPSQQTYAQWLTATGRGSVGPVFEASPTTTTSSASSSSGGGGIVIFGIVLVGLALLLSGGK